MASESHELEWREAVDRGKTMTENAFRRYADRYFWREYDLQGYMYKALYREPVLRPYIRREHRVWYKTKDKQVLVLDFALLDPTKSPKGYPDWPVKEMIQLKYPVEFKTGKTQPDDLDSDKVASSQSYYRGRCRTRIRAKIWEDYKKYVKAKGKARNVGGSARCHIMYFDLAEKPSYSGSEELRGNFQERMKVNPHRIGKWPLLITYVHSYPTEERKSTDTNP